MACALVALGSNLGDRRQTLDRAVELLRNETEIGLLAVSPWHRSAPVGGPTGQGEFCNGAVRLETQLAPQALLDRLHDIEAHLGRTRQQRWEPRTLDLDLLLYDERVVTTETLTLPHPRMAVRRFVLEPAAQVAGDMVHPTIGWTVDELLAHLNTAPPYVAITGLPGTGKTALARWLHERFGGRLLADPIAQANPQEPLTKPAGQEWQREIRFLGQRAELLDRLPEGTPPGDALRVSDFWLGQSLAYAALWLAVHERGRFEAEWQAAAGRATQPKLLVWLDAPAETLRPRNTERNLPDQGEPTLQTLERLQASLGQVVNRGGHGPILHLDARRPKHALEEVCAAIEAMR